LLITVLAFKVSTITEKVRLSLSPGSKVSIVLETEVFEVSFLYSDPILSA